MIGFWAVFISNTVYWDYIHEPQSTSRGSYDLPKKQVKLRSQEIKQEYHIRQYDTPKPKHNHQDRFDYRTDCDRCLWDRDQAWEEHMEDLLIDQQYDH